MLNKASVVDRHHPMTLYSTLLLSPGSILIYLPQASNPELQGAFRSQRGCSRSCFCSLPFPQAAKHLVFPDLPPWSSTQIAPVCANFPGSSLKDNHLGCSWDSQAHFLLGLKRIETRWPCFPQLPLSWVMEKKRADQGCSFYR